MDLQRGSRGSWGSFSSHQRGARAPKGFQWLLKRFWRCFKGHQGHSIGPWKWLRGFKFFLSDFSRSLKGDMSSWRSLKCPWGSFVGFPDFLGIQRSFRGFWSLKKAQGFFREFKVSWGVSSGIQERIKYYPITVLHSPLGYMFLFVLKIQTYETYDFHQKSKIHHLYLHTFVEKVIE